jgi:hypothetical protein
LFFFFPPEIFWEEAEEFPEPQMNVVLFPVDQFHFEGNSMESSSQSEASFSDLLLSNVVFEPQVPSRKRRLKLDDDIFDDDPILREFTKSRRENTEPQEKSFEVYIDLWNFLELNQCYQDLLLNWAVSNEQKVCDPIIWMNHVSKIVNQHICQLETITEIR